MQFRIEMRAIVFFIVVLYLASYKAYCTPLDDYVNMPDPHYKYELIKTYVMPGYKLYILNMTSQKWLDGEMKILFKRLY